MIGYWRVSLAREEMISPSIQQDTGRAWARRNGRRIVTWIGDPDQTGRNFRRRITEAIAAIEAGQATEIGVFRYDRWGRNALESLANVKRVEDAGGAVHSFTEPVDAETATGRFSRGMAFQMAEYQSGMIGDNWKAAHASRILRGLPAVGTPRFGYVRLGRIPDPVRPHVYRRNPDDPLGERYAQDPVTAPVLAGLYERYINGEAKRALAAGLNAAGVKTVTGGRWSAITLDSVLLSGFGAGLIRAHDLSCKCQKGGRGCPRVVYYPGAHEPVIEPWQWEAFLERRGERRTLPPRLHTPLYPLSGLLFCGTCGYRLGVVFNYGQPGWGYRCPHRGQSNPCETGVLVRRTVAEAAVLNWLGELAGEADAQSRAELARGAKVTRARADTSALAAEETRIRKAIARLLEQQAFDEETPAEAYDGTRRKLLADLEAIQARRQAARAAESRNAGAFLPFVVSLLEEWDTFPPAARREGLGKLIDRVVVHHTGFRQPPRIEIVPVWEAVTEP